MIEKARAHRGAADYRIALCGGPRPDYGYDLAAGVRMICGGLLLLVAFRPAWPRRHAGLLIAVAVPGIAGA